VDNDPKGWEPLLHPADPDAIPPWRQVSRTEVPDYWTKFGNSSTRSEEQQQEGKRFVTGLLDDQHIQCFTDGSRIEDAVGSGALVKFPCGEVAEMSESLGRGNGGNGLGELFGIWIALQMVGAHVTDQARRCVCVHSPLVSVCSLFSDSQSALRVVGYGGRSAGFPRLANKIRSCIFFFFFFFFLLSGF